MAPPGFFGRHKHVLWYVPNLIGYARIVATLYAFAVCFSQPWQTLLFYFLAFVCDELDGRFARMLGQTSTLGAVLDMVTDRLATTGMLAILTALYPAWHLLFISLIFLDIFSHWFQMYASLLMGASTHKDAGSRSWLVSFYYSNRIFMGFCCICCEVLYLAAYALYFANVRQHRSSLVVRLPPSLAAALPAGLGEVFSPEGLPWAALLLAAAVPGVLVKQLCNWVQLREAASQLVQHEVKKIR